MTRTPNRRFVKLISGSIAAAAFLAAIASCATQPPPPVEPVRLSASVAPVSIAALDLDTVRFVFRASLSSDGPGSSTIPPLELALDIDGSRAAEVPVAFDPASAGRIERGESLAAEIQITLDRGQLAEAVPDIDKAATATWRATLAGGGLSADVSGEFPIVHEPGFEISSLKIERWDLVQTKLKLSISVTNPNAFPITFSKFDYLFYGEGRIWTEGNEVPIQSVPAESVGTVDIPLTMNFIEMGRKLFDLVAELRVVEYRLKGSSVVETPLEFLSSFVFPFDKSGSIRVEK